MLDFEGSNPFLDVEGRCTCSVEMLDFEGSSPFCFANIEVYGSTT